MALVLHTSGTTSRPKIVPLTHGNLCASAGNVRRSLALGPADRCLNVMPLFHIHGLVAAVLSSLGAGGSVVCTPGFDAAQFGDWLDEFAPTWYTAVPTMHQAALARAERDGRPLRRDSLRFVRSCSSSLPPQLMAALEEAYGVPVVEAYGMTEAAHQMSCNPLPPGVRKPGSVGLPTGVEISIRDEAGDALPTGERGEVCIRGRNVTHGYESNPKANRKSFTDGWFRTGDEGCLDEDGYLRLTDRLKEIINRGGEKVSPREVDEVLMDHESVAQALTFAVPHAELGEDVVAAVVPRPGTTPDGQELREFAAARLAEFKVPRQIVVVDTIPKGPTGKLQRIGMHERLGHLLHVEYVAPRDEVETALAGIWAELLHLERVGLNDNFFLSGGSSLSAVQMLSRVRSAFDAEVRLDAFFRRSTLADLADAVRDGGRRRAAGGRVADGDPPPSWPCSRTGPARRSSWPSSASAGRCATWPATSARTSPSTACGRSRCWTAARAGRARTRSRGSSSRRCAACARTGRTCSAAAARRGWSRSRWRSSSCARARACRSWRSSTWTTRRPVRCPRCSRRR